jgi:hypothetical protein
VDVIEPEVSVRENSLQDILWLEIQRNHSMKLEIPNTSLWFWESDLIAVTGSDFCHEYEIKISRADFRADANKKNKHRILKSATGGPNYFWYVCMPGIIDEADVPKYAGLIHLIPAKLNVRHRTGYNTVVKATTVMKIIKQAPRRHATKMKDKGKDFIARGLMLRYWSLRCKNDIT